MIRIELTTHRPISRHSTTVDVRERGDGQMASHLCIEPLRAHTKKTIPCVYLFLTPNSRSVFRAGVSLNIHSYQEVNPIPTGLVVRNLAITPPRLDICMLYKYIVFNH